MPKRNDIDSILIIGAGPIVIGQACEFDYSGTQACKALHAEGYRIILVNSNPATMMTDPELAHVTYIEPITPEIVAKIIAQEQRKQPKEKMVLLPTMGGQTALNTALSLERKGVLAKYNVEMIGANAKAIDKAEDRDLFRKSMTTIGLATPRSAFVNTTDLKKQFLAEKKEHFSCSDSSHRKQKEWEAGEGIRYEKHRLTAQVQALEAYKTTGLPAIIRPSFTMGGQGGGIAYTLDELYELVLSGVEASPTNEVLVEESILGWKEYEMEVMRDKADNCIIICSIENVDPMGVHTGDSITVSPALTLTDKEYQTMRNASIAILREIGVHTGGSNVQFAVNPQDGRLLVIEMNPRVSRSSALASKATGFPIAKIAAKLAVGYTLDELGNDITGGATPASFEPSIDYVVTKIPRFPFEKFPMVSDTLTTSMKSVGEVMAIGRTFSESLQKALRSLETGLCGLDETAIEGLSPNTDISDNKNAICKSLSTPKPNRILKVAQAIREGLSIEEIYNYCRIDMWFLRQLKSIIMVEDRIKAYGLPKDQHNLRMLKSMGFSDKRLANLSNSSPTDVANLRKKLNIYPVYKRIDTCAAEFDSPTAYMYSTYESPFGEDFQCESQVSKRPKIIILGGGPNRIGQGIEFDYCCCHAAFALAHLGYESIIVNCNPETVSTDYDTSDRLYFEPLTTEDVLEIIRTETQEGQLLGVIVQFGGQTPLSLAHDLELAGVTILGTPSDSIDLAEDRDRFQKFLMNLNLIQPRNRIANSRHEALKIVNDIPYPIVIRPSYVLGGRGMEIIYSKDQFERYINQDVIVSSESPVLIENYLTHAIEVDVDCLSDGTNIFICGVMEHIEEAGIHSGDSACSLPSHSLSDDLLDELENQTKTMAKALHVVGLMNVQFAIKDETIYVLEVNPRASRTVPFVAKTIGLPIARIAAQLIAGEKLEKVLPNRPDIRNLNHIAVKEAVFPFTRFPGFDPLLGPEMRSTGEVMGLASEFSLAFAKAQIGASNDLPREGTVFISVKNSDKLFIIDSARKLASVGFRLLATNGTYCHLLENGINSHRINKVLEGHPHIEDSIRNRQIDVIFNTTQGQKSRSDSRSLRQAALINKVPYYTTISGCIAATDAILVLIRDEISVTPLQDYFRTIQHNE
ncbi:carbamoyl-phosphate synthase large subunit [Candidatus Endowatersipora endosymbiont of Watersipora subatra]|uniref:carbamoyl-phosphate synthase large subunit n=1 Tax=Candidatus Endowatersipora endosymbiont of Watersipora subatra TaxID=3077946 RepID=UPI00312CA55E